ncbi:hypothetical protein PM082_023627 [Marasmius tenuissimus]|nr:hypothetical protein PM082_023627 [Marasmius tenuissimus]
MAQTQNFGDTISNGIQDIAALLPLLGTEQCERHVGDALQKGYLYAAAAPLSIFGSLGVVKISFATFVAAMTRPFYGGSWLHDAGFGTTGSVASMVTLAPGTKRYGAEVRLERLMKEQHIDNPGMILSIERFGWKKAEGAAASLLRPNLSWNLCLILTSALASIVALTPYIYLAINDQRNALVWMFPALRSFGSFLCVVSTQLVLQRRIHYITSSSLFLMKERHRDPLSIEKAIQEQDMLLESRLKTLPVQSSERRASDLEKGSTSETQRRGHDSGNHMLVALQVSLVVGMGMIVTGYVGCFNLVSQTSAKNGPYAWFGAEAALSILRLLLWGSNPSWDEQDTGLTVRLGLLPKLRPLSVDAEERNCLGARSDPELIPVAQAQQVLAVDHIFPLITSPHPLRLLTERLSSFIIGQDTQWRQSFVAHYVEDFLTGVSPYVGPLGRIEIDGSSIYYAILADVSHESSRKLLCATAVPRGARWNSLTFLVGGGKHQHTIFASRTRQLPGTNALEVAFVEEFEGESTGFLDSRAINLIIDYSNTLFHRLVAPPDMDSNLHLSWSLAFFDAPSPSLTETLAPLSYLDSEYMRIGQICDLKGDCCLSKSGRLIGDTIPDVGSSEDRSIYKEYALIFESAILETYLCITEHRFVKRAGLSDTLSHHLGLQWIQKMEARLSAEQLASHERISSFGGPILHGYREIWETLSSEMRLLRLLPANSPELERWEYILFPVPFDRTPPVSELMGLKLLTGSPYLSQFFYSLFIEDESDQSLSGAYFHLIDHVRFSIQRLRSITPPPCFGRMDPKGPGSPEFSPPYVSIRLPLKEGSTDKFITQIQSTEILYLPTAKITWKGVFSILHSLPNLPSTFTTLVLRSTQLTLEPYRELLSLLKKHTNFTFFIDNGSSNCVGVSFLVRLNLAIGRNRRRWRENALQLRLPQYQIGLQTQQDWNKEWEHSDPSPIESHMEDLCLRRDVVVVAMIRIPYHRKIVPVLLAKGKTVRGGGVFVATIFQWSQDDVDDQWAVCSTKKKIKPSEQPSKWDPLRFDAFPEVAPGCYQVHIHAEEVDEWIFRKLTIEFIPTYQFQFSLHGPEGPKGDHGNSIFFSRGTVQIPRLKELSMVLFPLTGNLVLHPDWAALSTCNTSGTGKTSIARHAVTPQSEIDGLDEHPGSGEQEGQPQNSGEGPEAMEQTTCWLEANYDLSNGSSPDDSESEYVLLPTYRFQFSLRSPEGHRHHRSFHFSPETTYHKLEIFTMVLDPLNNELRLDRYWLDPRFGHAFWVTEEGIVWRHAAFNSSEIDVLFDPSLPREQEERPQSSEELSSESSDEASVEDSAGRRAEKENRVPLAPSPNGPGCHSGRHSTSCQCLVLWRPPLNPLSAQDRVTAYS